MMHLNFDATIYQSGYHSLLLKSSFNFNTLAAVPSCVFHPLCKTHSAALARGCQLHQRSGFWPLRKSGQGMKPVGMAVLLLRGPLTRQGELDRNRSSSAADIIFAMYE